MTAAKAPSSQQMRRALETICRAFGPGWQVSDLVPAHVEYRAELGGAVDTFRVYAVDGERVALVAQVPRAALEPAPPRRPGLAPERWTEDEA